MKTEIWKKEGWKKNMTNLEEAIPYLPITPKSEAEKKKISEEALKLVRKVFKDIQNGHLV